MQRLFHFFSTELNLEDFLQLGKEIADLNLTHDSTLLLLKHISIHHTQAMNYYHHLLQQRNIIATQDMEISSILAETMHNTYHLISLGRRTYDELIYVQISLQQSCHVHQILNTMMELGFNTHQYLQQHHDNPEEFMQNLIKFRHTLESALQAINEVSTFSMTFASIIEKIKRMPPSESQTANESEHGNIVSFFDEIQVALCDLNTESYRQKQHYQSLMWIKFTETEHLKTHLLMYQRSAAYHQNAMSMGRQSLDYLNAKIEKAQRDLAMSNHHISIQTQIAERLSTERLKLQHKWQEEHKRHLSPYNTNIAPLREHSTYQRVLNDVQPIVIQDILVTHSPASELEDMGELGHHVEEKELYIARMLLQIKLLADIAEQQHKKNCTAEGVLKEDCKNNITRLTTDEFSFYPHEPLTIDSYVYLIREICEIVKKLPLNIHLILATFPVLSTRQQLHNIILHITSGEEPILHHRSKAVYSNVDPHYGYPLACNYLPWLNPKMPLINFDQPLSFDFGSIVCSETAGGSRLLSNVTICKEHEFNISANCLNEVVKWSKYAGEIIPVQYSHVLSSRTILVTSGKPNKARITQADAHNPGIWTQDNDHSYWSHQPSTVLYLNNRFGKSNHVSVFEPQSVAYLPDHLFKMAVNDNLQTVNNPLVSVQELEPPAYQLFA